MEAEAQLRESLLRKEPRQGDSEKNADPRGTNHRYFGSPGIFPFGNLVSASASADPPPRARVVYAP